MVFGVELLLECVITAQYALQSTAAFEELFPVLRTKHIEKSLLLRFLLSQSVEILEQRVLPNRFRPALPTDEFEFRDALIGLQVKLPSGVSCAKRDVLNHLARPKNMRKTQKYA